MLNKRSFTDIAEAEKFCDEQEALGCDVVSMIYIPFGKKYIVSYGKVEQETELQGLNKMFNDIEKQKNEELVAEAEKNALCDVAHELAKEIGMNEEDAGFFVSGFCKKNIKEVNPRKFGKEAVFKLGNSERNKCAKRINMKKEEHLRLMQSEKSRTVFPFCSILEQSGE